MPLKSVVAKISPMQTGIAVGVHAHTIAMLHLP